MTGLATESTGTEPVEATTAQPSRRPRVPASLRSWAGLVALTVLAVAVQPGLSRYDQDVITTLLLWVAGASAWNVVGGMAGQFSLAHSPSSAAARTSPCCCSVTRASRH